MDLISIIGTIASVGGIPLAIYLFIRSKEANQDKVKREIVRILSHQIGDGRELSAFEIQAVINSKLRENKLNPDLIDVNEVIEDLITEIISNPLIENDKKNFYLKNFNKIFTKSKLYQVIENLSLDEEILKLPEPEKEKYLEKEVKELMASQKEVAEIIKSEKEKSRISDKTSTLFGFIAAITTVATTTIGLVQDFGGLNIFENIKLNTEVASIIMGIVASITAGILVTFVKRIENK